MAPSLRVLGLDTAMSACSAALCQGDRVLANRRAVMERGPAEALVPMVREARGRDVTPGMIAVFEKANVDHAVAALNTIYAEEVGPVAYGSKWFHFLCGRDDLDPKDAFHGRVQRYFHGALKPPFNDSARRQAGLTEDFYAALAS